MNTVMWLLLVRHISGQIKQSIGVCVQGYKQKWRACNFKRQQEKKIPNAYSKLEHNSSFILKHLASRHVPLNRPHDLKVDFPINFSFKFFRALTVILKLMNSFFNENIKLSDRDHAVILVKGM